MKKRFLFAALLTSMAVMLTGCGDSDKYTTIDASIESKLTKLADYKGLPYNVEEVTVTDEEVQEEMEMEMSWYGEYKAIEGKTLVENGDTVNIAFKGLIDGVEFEGGTAESYDLTLGSGEMIDGFEEGIVGKNVGDAFSIDLVFPEDYYDTEVAGKNVTFEITVNQIEEYIEPELTDEFVKENLDYENVDAFRTATKESLIESKMEEVEYAAQGELIQSIIDNSTFEMVEDEVEAYRQDLIAEYESYAEMYGMEYGDFLEMFMGTTQEEFEETSKSEAETQIKTILVYQEIVDKENLGITEKEYTESLAKMAEEYEYESPEEFEEEYEKASLISDMLYEKAMQFIIDNAKTE
ncbi:MAG: trigger factor [Lachnospiraceae bacterium]|nr:trigger factor [Lachnospiraceae bacterium]